MDLRHRIPPLPFQCWVLAPLPSQQVPTGGGTCSYVPTLLFRRGAGNLTRAHDTKLTFVAHSSRCINTLYTLYMQASTHVHSDLHKQTLQDSLLSILIFEILVKTLIVDMFYYKCLFLQLSLKYLNNSMNDGIFFFFFKFCSKVFLKCDVFLE